MTDDQLLSEFVRVRPTAERIFFEVKVLEHGSDSFSERWTLAAALPQPATSMAVARTRLMLLSDYRHFRACDDCGERLPRGSFVAEFDQPDLCPECRSEV